MAAKTLLYTAADETLAPINTYSGENKATKLVVDFSNCGVDTYVKWVRFSNSEPILLGTAISVEYEIPVAFMARGRLEVQPYAIGPDGQVVKFAIRAIPVNRSLEESDENTYDPTNLESIQTAVSDAVIQVGAIWEAYNTGELDGADGLDGTNGIDGVDGADGATPVSVAFVGNDIVFTKSDATTITLVGAKLDLKGEVGATGATGADGEDGKTIVSASFVGNDLVFVNNDSSTVTLLNAKLSLKGDQGIQGISGISAYQVALNNGFVGTESEWLLSLKGEKGDTGSIADLGGVIAGLTEKTTPVDADKFVISDSADTNHEKRLSWSNIKATLKTYFDTLYNNYVHPTTAGNKHIPAGGSANQVLKYSSDGTAVWGTDNDTIYTHPANHPASIITQDSLNRFVTDAEKVTWSGKANSSHTHTIENVSGLQTALDGKLSSVPNANTQLASLGVGTAPSGTAGEIRATNNITAYYSDARLKTFLGKIPDALDKIKSLNGYIFVENEKAKELGYSNDRVQVGVSAQEVQSVLPEAVTEAPIGQGYLTVWYEKLVPLLIEGVKEQQAQIDALKQEVRRLRGD